MKSEIKKIIEKELSRYQIKEIKILNKKYPLYIIPELCDEDLNIFEGFLFVEAENKSEVSYLKTKYKPPVSGYTPRLGIIFYDGHLLIKDYRRNRHIIKTLKKINKTFLNKLKKAFSEPKEENLSKLFDRTDVIEEFYILYKKAREYLLKNISGIPEEEKREEFIDNFMMQMLTLWYLQERGFFNGEKDYFITRFKIVSKIPLTKQKEQSSLFTSSYKQLFFKKFPSFYHFLIYLFEKISGNINSQYYKDEFTGKVVVVGPAIFLNGEHSKAISIPDKCFYKEGMTDILINTPPKKVSQEVPLLNLFESRDWTEGNIDEFVLGAIYEKLITYMERKKLGAYYTPEEITSYICKNTIEPYLIDKVNERFNKSFENIDQIVESNDKEILLYLFEQLKEIKILDPAVGSAHFLESAINVLVEIYEKIREKVRELNIKKGLEIKASDEKGEIKTINLLEITDDDEFKLFVKFYIILSKNIYGVDINPSALKVAKARLFLTLAKHFKVGKEKDIFIRFPNVHFNLREGNSLIGYVELGEEKKAKQQTLFDFIVKEEQVEYISKRIKVVSELKPYLEKTAKVLGINRNIVKEVEDLNKILSKEKITWNDFEKVLRIKEKIVRILIVSLNSQYAKPLNELLREITNLFNQKLDEKFAEEHNIAFENLKKIKTFHWVFEFPEVFLDKDGFDVVVGNPPYVRADTDDEFIIKERELIIKTKFYETLYEKWDIYVAFIERGFKLLKEKGYFSLIVEDSYNSSKYAKKSHNYIIENATVKELNFCSDVSIFQGVGVRNTIFIFKKEANPDNTPRRLKRVERFENIQFLSSATQKDFGIDLFNPRKTPGKGWVINAKTHNVIPLGKICYISVGMVLNAHEKRFKGEFEKDDLISDVRDDVHPVAYLEGKMIGRWQIKQVKFLEWGTKRVPNKVRRPTFPELYKPPKILFGRITKGTYDNIGFFCNDSIIVIKPWINLKSVFNRSISKKAKGELRGQFEKISLQYELKFLLMILNSTMGSYFIKQNQRNKLSVYPDDLSNLEIRICNKKAQGKFSFLSDYLLFLNATDERRQKLKEMIKFFDCQIADSLIYELYFKEKFAEDGLYPNPKEYLLETVSTYLKPINYDRWAKLYWKKQLEGYLTPEEEKEFEELEKENMETISKVYEAIKIDFEIQKLVEKIKSHKWVKIIEGETHL